MAVEMLILRYTPKEVFIQERLVGATTSHLISSGILEQLDLKHPLSKRILFICPSSMGTLGLPFTNQEQQFILTLVLG